MRQQKIGVDNYASTKHLTFSQELSLIFILSLQVQPSQFSIKLYLPLICHSNCNHFHV
jgi:hypothetical protein